MGKKSKNKSKKGSKPTDKHGRKCSCDDCVEKRSSRKWNKRRTEVEKDKAQVEKAKATSWGAQPGFFAGGHQKLKRDFAFEEGDWSESLSPLHMKARAFINRMFPKGNMADLIGADTPLWRRNAAKESKIARGYQIDNDVTKFKGQQVDLLWHGTSARNVSSIGHQSLRVGGPYCLLGAGIYLTPDFLKAWNFSGWGSYSTVLLCAANLGKILNSQDCVNHADDCGKNNAPWGKCSKACKWVRPNAATVKGKGYDSACAMSGGFVGAFGGRLVYSEYCCYDIDQVVPLYALVFKGR